MTQNHHAGSLKHRWLDPTPKFFDLIGLGWRLRISISNKLPSDADAAGLGTTLLRMTLYYITSLERSRIAPHNQTFIFPHGINTYYIGINI